MCWVFWGSVTATSLHGTSCPLDLKTRWIKENSKKFSIIGLIAANQNNDDSELYENQHLALLFCIHYPYSVDLKWNWTFSIVVHMYFNTSLQHCYAHYSKCLQSHFIKQCAVVETLPELSRRARCIHKHRSRSGALKRLWNMVITDMIQKNLLCLRTSGSARGETTTIQPVLSYRIHQKAFTKYYIEVWVLIQLYMLIPDYISEGNVDFLLDFIQQLTVLYRLRSYFKNIL